MQIYRLALKNFKCFKEVDVSFSKITLLTGENSSGKSSLIYGLLAALQSINPIGESFPYYLSLNGKYINMGGFKDVSFNHILNNHLGIDINLNEEEFQTIWSYDVLSKSPILNYLNIPNLGEVKQKDDRTYNINLKLPESTNELDKEFYASLNKNDFPEIVEGILDELNIHLSSFNFISSFRFHPDRTYYQSLANNMVDRFGVGYIDQILRWNDNQSKELLDFVSILQDLKILYNIKSYKLSGGRFEIRVKVKNKSKWESLPDVGFGISQFLPIIVADLQLSNNSTLIMSQPEIHLHPSVQANLSDYLVKQVKERNKNYIVETHSEYLLNRMRLLIVKGEIQSEDVAVYYFENSIKDGSVAHRIEFTKDGQILNAPKGFFETYMIDTMDIALNA
ncbi:MAG: AAA family ATPase [Pseudanabaena sp.]|jgi:predicted ATPase